MHPNIPRLVPAAIAAVGMAALVGCTATPPAGVPTMRAVPADGVDSSVMDVSDGAIVEFLPGDTIAIRFGLDSPLGHLDGGSATSTLVIDRRFLVYSNQRSSSISFDDGLTWAPAHRALDGAFDFGWERNDPGEENGAVSEIRLEISARPR